MNSSIKVVKGKYVVHFLSLLTDSQKYMKDGYSQALAHAKRFGGRKFHNKDYGGGIAFDYEGQAEEALAMIGL